ncbi:hypothetical protein [Frankia sp. Cj3]|uniref:hypothetical protein n=1 Tax=Frankia sp. Cj3 TaxID=2880976 RepID=UPI001EF66199|nr:hypothetical protein [Frankia sp. Cj3]
MDGDDVLMEAPRPSMGFDPRVLADELWEAGNYEAANEVGRFVPDIPGRVCRLTGMQAHGYARIPGTIGAADVAISHGAYEKVPTPLQRWNGWEGLAPERPLASVAARGSYLVLVLGRTDKGPIGGIASVMGLKAEGQVRVEYLPDGTVTVERVEPGGVL